MSDDTSSPKDATLGRRRRASSKILGANGERFAATWLEASGYAIVERNWRCAYGELDIVARSGAEWVFCEVKTRRGRGMGAPEEAVTRTKRARLVLSAQAYLSEHGCEDAPYRIDVLALELSPAGALIAVRHYPRGVELEEV
ncbi:MAG TPA: YraN family protein [Ktedonobacterales bacterium]|nr:YraN family protein [Ktedonobacterales bacterium]